MMIILLLIIQLSGCGKRPELAALPGEVQPVMAVPQTLTEELAGSFLPGWEGSGALRKWRTESGGYAVGLTEIDGEWYWFDWDGTLATGWAHGLAVCRVGWSACRWSDGNRRRVVLV